MLTSSKRQTTPNAHIHGHAIFDNLYLQCPLALSEGHVNKGVNIEYSLYGDPGLPVTVVLGGISASREVTQDGNLLVDKKSRKHGWWQELVGKGKAVNTEQTCVLSFNYIPQLSVNTSLGHNQFCLTPTDQAVILKALLANLNLNSPITFVGSSYGGMVGLSFAELFPNSIEQLVCISASDRSTHTARGLRKIQKSLLEIASDEKQARDALSLARQLSILFYRTEEIFKVQFDDPVPHDSKGQIIGFEQTIFSYLNHQGGKFAKSFSIDDYSALLDSIDSHSVNASQIQCECHFIAVPSDRLVSFDSMRRLAHNVKGLSQFYRLDSIYGHDAFLKEFRSLTKLLKKILGENDEPSTSYTSC
ncbi:alpha/beta fold hydrolase [Kangiella sediminilitoris]|uniref:alpha/beta fold hydrolase n=1 Tax=Kangiella sediminilitoris TaxID=1144748 RepID=UPI00083D18C2|nr:alpha/beta fold hydrolase [Kangiella sediminilitoris]